jgi:hypothetical protein
MGRGDQVARTPVDRAKKLARKKYFGSKSTTLETVGLFLPLIAHPQDIWGRHILLQTDNTVVVYSWKKKYCGGDPETSLLIRCLHVLESFLE